MSLRAIVILALGAVTLHCVPLRAREADRAHFGLESWKVTLPVDTPRKGVPDEVSGAELTGFTDGKHFFTDAEGRLVFRAHCDGVATKGSRYPRCELRELEAGKEASWDTAEKKLHVLEAGLAVTGLPKRKPHVVVAQVHDAKHDVLMVRLEGEKLLIEREGMPDVRLADGLALGEPFVLRIEAGEGRIRLWFNGRLSLDWEVAARGCYFKVGCYVQSNPDKGDGAESFGEVRVCRLSRE